MAERTRGDGDVRSRESSGWTTGAWIQGYLAPLGQQQPAVWAAGLHAQPSLAACGGPLWRPAHAGGDLPRRQHDGTTLGRRAVVLGPPPPPAPAPVPNRPCACCAAAATALQPAGPKSAPSCLCRVWGGPSQAGHAPVVAARRGGRCCAAMLQRLQPQAQQGMLWPAPPDHASAPASDCVAPARKLTRSERGARRRQQQQRQQRSAHPWAARPARSSVRMQQIARRPWSARLAQSARRARRRQREAAVAVRRRASPRSGWSGCGCLGVRC